MKKIKLAFYALTFIALTTACEKNEVFEVRYEAETGWTDDVLIEWTTRNGGQSGGEITDIGWNDNDPVYTYSFEGVEGMHILFTGVAPNSFWKLNIRLYVNGELKQSAVSSSGVKAIIEYTL